MAAQAHKKKSRQRAGLGKIKYDADKTAPV
jgi:hypothetical protein